MAWVRCSSRLTGCRVGAVLEIPFPNDNYAPIILTWKKECGGGYPKDVVIEVAGDVVFSNAALEQEWDSEAGTYVADSPEASTVFSLAKTRGAKKRTRFDTPIIEAGAGPQLALHWRLWVRRLWVKGGGRSGPGLQQHSCRSSTGSSVAAGSPPAWHERAAKRRGGPLVRIEH